MENNLAHPIPFGEISEEQRDAYKGVFIPRGTCAGGRSGSDRGAREDPDAISICIRSLLMSAIGNLKCVVRF